MIYANGCVVTQGDLKHNGSQAIKLKLKPNDFQLRVTQTILQNSKKMLSEYIRSWVSMSIMF